MTTLNLQVSASADDAWENAGGTVVTNGTALGSLSTGNMWAGFRWQNVTVPQGATVSSATAQFYIVSTANDDAVFDLYGQNSDNAAAFAVSANDISGAGRPRTTAKGSANTVAAGVGWLSVDVTAVVQEIVSRGGWASGNAMALIMDGLPGISLQIRAYDGTPAEAAKLDIIYTATGGGGLAVKKTYYARMMEA